MLIYCNLSFFLSSFYFFKNTFLYLLTSLKIFENRKCADPLTKLFIDSWQMAVLTLLLLISQANTMSMLSTDLLSWAIYIDPSLTSEEFNIHEACVCAYSLSLQPQMVTLNVSVCSSEMPTCRVQWTSRMVLASKYMTQKNPDFHVPSCQWKLQIYSYMWFSGLLWCCQCWADTQTAFTLLLIKEPMSMPKTSGAALLCTEG